jgi:DNA-binding response OmpR family regulator
VQVVREEARVAVTVLIVEDEVKIRDLLRGYFEREGFSVVTTGSGAEGISLARSVEPDLLVLDLRLPDVPGEAVAAEVRSAADLPILMLTAKAGETDRIRGLELGADDYVTKPFSPREVVLRARAILRRSVERSGRNRADQRSLGGGALVIDEDRHQVTVASRPIDLTPTEFALLVALAARPGRVYSRGELLNRVRGYEIASERTVDTHVKNLRRKIEPDPARPRIVETVVGVGYRLGLELD